MRIKKTWWKRSLNNITWRNLNRAVRNLDVVLLCRKRPIHSVIKSVSHIREKNDSLLTYSFFFFYSFSEYISMDVFLYFLYNLSQTSWNISTIFPLKLLFLYCGYKIQMICFGKYFGLENVCLWLYLWRNIYIVIFWYSSDCKLVLCLQTQQGQKNQFLCCKKPNTPSQSLLCKFTEGLLRNPYINTSKCWSLICMRAG